MGLRNACAGLFMDLCDAEEGKWPIYWNISRLNVMQALVKIWCKRANHEVLSLVVKGRSLLSWFAKQQEELQKYIITAWCQYVRGRGGTKMLRKGNGSDGTEVRFQPAISPRQVLTATMGSYLRANHQNLDLWHRGDQGQMTTHTKDGLIVGKSDDIDNEKAQKSYACSCLKSPKLMDYVDPCTWTGYLVPRFASKCALANGPARIDCVQAPMVVGAGIDCSTQIRLTTKSQRRKESSLYQKWSILLLWLLSLFVQASSEICYRTRLCRESCRYIVLTHRLIWEPDKNGRGDWQRRKGSVKDRCYQRSAPKLLNAKTNIG